MSIDELISTLQMENELVLFDPNSGKIISKDGLSDDNQKCYDAHEQIISLLSKLKENGEDIIHTCLNCSHYHGCLFEKNSQYHIHNYCDIWNKEIPNTVIFDRLNCESGFDDIECGLASCWAFEGNKYIYIESDFQSMKDNPKEEN